MKRYAPEKDNVKWLGRAYLMDEKLMLGYSASGIHFITEGAAFTVGFIGDSTAGTGRDESRVAIYVDENRMLDFLIDKKEKQVTISGLTDAKHTVKVIKLSECNMSTCAIEYIECDNISPAPNKETYIEFIGDSITCGYGVDTDKPEDLFATSNEDVTKAYAYKTAGLLDADCACVSLSGFGIISGYTDNPDELHDDGLIPDYYEKAGLSYNSLDGYKIQNTDWDFSLYTPDACVINLGTNDFSYCQADEVKCTGYKDKYKEFLEMVRKHNPSATILCVLGLMGEELCEYMEQAASEFSKEKADNHIYTLRMPVQTEEEGRVSDFHPTEKAHERAAKQVSQKLRELLLV